MVVLGSNRLSLLDHALEQLAARAARRTCQHGGMTADEARKRRERAMASSVLNTTISHPNESARHAQKMAMLRESRA